MIWISMFYEFFKTGLMAAGGGLATLPFLYAMAAKTGWFTTTDIANMVAVSESTPGPLGVNMATYVGFQVLGIPGGIWSTLSLTCPAIIVVTCISRAMKRFEHSVTVQKIFYGLRPASSALILAAGLGVVKIAFFTVAGGAAHNLYCPFRSCRNCFQPLIGSHRYKKFLQKILFMRSTLLYNSMKIRDIM